MASRSSAPDLREYRAVVQGATPLTASASADMLATGGTTPELTNEEVARRYAEAATTNDLAQLEALRHREWRVIWPQSGEQVFSSRDFHTIIDNYPGGHATTRIRRIVGSEDRWVVTPGNTVLRIAGSGDFWWGEWSVTYPDGRSYLCIDLMELRDGKVWRETVYWAEPFEAPDWRREWVRLDPKEQVASD